MLPVNGLYGHISRNNTKSGVLLASFAVLVLLFWLAFCLLLAALTVKTGRHADTFTAFDLILASAVRRATATWWMPVLISGAWFLYAWRKHADMIRRGTGTRPVSRVEEPGLYNLVENLAITAGLPMPRVEIMDTPALNAYATGLSPETATIAVTRGLLDTLEPDELEAVLAHEMGHIRNYDVRLMVVATIFCGGLTMLGGLVARGASSSPPTAADTFAVLGRRRRGDRSQGGSGAVVLAVLIAAALLIITHVFARLAKLAISRSREYMADAGAVELTKRPDSLISALRKISGNDEVPLAAESLRAMMISSQGGVAGTVAQLLSTHPAIEDRIASLVAHAGGNAQAVSPRRAPRPTRNLPPVAGAVPGPIAGLAATRASFGQRRRMPAGPLAG